MYRNILFSMLCVFMGSVSSYAQQHEAPPVQLFSQLGYISWSVNFPMSNDFVSETSFRGGSIGYRKMLNNGKVSLGADFSWNSYDEYSPRKTYHVNANTDVTTDLYKYMYTLPMSVNAHYYFMGGGIINPYVGIGLGTTYAKQELYYNTYVTEDYQWGFLVRPEIGAVIKPQPRANWGIMLGGRYNYSTNKQTEFKINSLQTFELQLGVAWDW